MDIKQFIEKNDVDMCSNTLDVKLLEDAEQRLGIKFGNELTEYLLKYGYLAYKYVELYGMNTRQGLQSDMVKQTLYLHEYYPETKYFVALENQGDGDYYLVDSDDRVVNFNSEIGNVIDTGYKLFDYIVDRFETAKRQEAD